MVSELNYHPRYHDKEKRINRGHGYYHTVSHVIPYIREAILANITHHPSKEEAEELGMHLINAWDSMLKEYKKIIASAADVRIDQLFLTNETPRMSWEGKTCLIDYPRVFHSHKRRIGFETRICISICTGEMSSKFWSRVGPSIDLSHFVPTVPIRIVNKTIKQYRNITYKCSEWLFKKGIETIEQYLPTLHITERGRLEISAFGVRDNSLQRYFEQLPETATMADLLEEKGANKKLSYYFSKFCGTPRDLRNFIADQGSEDLLCFTSPIETKVEGGYVEPREVLYIMRPLAEKAQAIGIAYDDSSSGDLPFKSALKVARLIGMKV